MTKTEKIYEIMKILDKAQYEVNDLFDECDDDEYSALGCDVWDNMNNIMKLIMNRVRELHDKHIGEKVA